MSHPRGKLFEVLLAEAAGQDLQWRSDCYIVCAMRTDGSLYEIGRVTHDLAAQNTDAARAAVERIKFAWQPRAVDSEKSRGVVPR